VSRGFSLLVVGGLAVTGACFFPDVSTLSGDSGGPSDAQTSESAPDASTTPSPCTASHTFCDDFDEPSLGTLWSGQQTPSGTLAFSTSAVTPPHSLQATVLADTNDNGAFLYERFTNVTRLHVELDAMVVAALPTANSQVDLVDIEVTPPSGGTFAVVDLQRWQDGSALEQYVAFADGGSSDQSPDFAETFSSWRHVALDVDFGAETFVATIDGTVAQTIDFTPSLPQGDVQVDVGVPYAESLSGDWQVFVDDVAIDVE